MRGYIAGLSALLALVMIGAVMYLVNEKANNDSGKEVIDGETTVVDHIQSTLIDPQPPLTVAETTTTPLPRTGGC